MDEGDKDLLRVVNQSGFPFQVGVRKEIERTTSSHGWRVVSEEHYWKHPDRDEGGYIDLIAEHGQFVFSLAIECKRVRSKDGKQGRGPSWIFLTPRGSSPEQGRLSGFVTDKRQDETSVKALDEASRGSPAVAFGAQVVKGLTRNPMGWADSVDFDPPTPESSYCVFEGQDERNLALERIADALLPSIEAIGAEWLTLGSVYKGDRRLFLPVVVTNAKLLTCTFDAESISMTEGMLPDVAEFREVPFIRFRKGLASGRVKKAQAPNFTIANEMQQRTLIVANAASLAETLGRIRMTDRGNYTLYHAFLAAGT